MNEPNSPYPQTITKSISISASPERVWEALTSTPRMAEWMSETPVAITTNWEVGSPFLVHGDWYKTGFLNKGQVMRYEPLVTLAYTHLSSLSRLPDTEENYTTIAFALETQDELTVVTLTLSNFPTEAIYRHFAFYWGVALHLLCRYVEQSATTSSSFVAPAR